MTRITWPTGICAGPCGRRYGPPPLPPPGPLNSPYCEACHRRWTRAGRPASGPPPAASGRDGWAAREANVQAAAAQLRDSVTTRPALAAALGVTAKTAASYQAEITARGFDAAGNLNPAGPRPKPGKAPDLGPPPPGRRLPPDVAGALAAQSLALAGELAVELRDTDAQGLAGVLDPLDRQELYGLIIAALALVPIDVPQRQLLAWVNFDADPVTIPVRRAS